MALVTEQVVKVTAPDGLAFVGSWTYDDQTGDLASVTWANPTAYTFNVEVSQPPRTNSFVIGPGSSGTNAVPQKRYSFVREPAPGDGWVPNFSFRVWRS